MVDEEDGQDQINAEVAEETHVEERINPEEVAQNERIEQGGPVDGAQGAQQGDPEGGGRGIQQEDPAGGGQGVQNENPVLVPIQQDGQQGIEVQVTTGLKEYLQKRTNGKIILKEFKKSSENRLPLKNNIKSLLVREVIGREKNYLLKNINADQCLDRFVITKERFEILANEICSIFIYEEPSVYFTASVKQGEQILVATGKLWNHYNYAKSVLRNANLLKNSKKNGPANVLNAEELEQVNRNDNIIWLSNHLGPWEEVLRKWTESYAERRALLVEANLSVYEYIDKIAGLKVQRAKELFAIDFKLLYPDKQQITAEQWIKIKSVLIVNLVSSGVKSLNESVLINILKTREFSADKEDFLILYLLCHIVKPKRNNKRTREAAENADPPRKLTFEERRETFILKVEVANDIQPKLLDLRQRYMQNRETFQPVIVAVGEPLRISSYYVVVNDKLFEVDTALKALDLAFQVFFSLDCKYPKNSETIWVFLQRILYNIDLQFDNLTLEVKGLIAHIRSL